jgi:hypothetical protein
VSKDERSETRTGLSNCKKRNFLPPIGEPRLKNSSTKKSCVPFSSLRLNSQPNGLLPKRFFRTFIEQTLANHLSNLLILLSYHFDYSCAQHQIGIWATARQDLTQDFKRAENTKKP